jgi:hypothetical protein
MDQLSPKDIHPLSASPNGPKPIMSGLSLSGHSSRASRMKYTCSSFVSASNLTRNLLISASEGRRGACLKLKSPRGTVALCLHSCLSRAAGICFELSSPVCVVVVREADRRLVVEAVLGRKVFQHVGSARCETPLQCGVRYIYSRTNLPAPTIAFQTGSSSQES